MLRFLTPALFLGVLTIGPLSLCAQLYELPFNEIIQRSGIVAEGRVIARQCLWDRSGSHIYTLNTVEITAVYKGTALAQSLLLVVTAGGVVADRMEIVSETVQYTLGNVGLFCLVPAARDLPVAASVWENYGSPHGYFRYDLAANAVEHPFHPVSGIEKFRKTVQDAAGELVEHIPGKALVPLPDARMAPVVSSFSPTAITAGTGSLLTISGTGFGSGPGLVRFIDSNSGSAFSADTSDIVSWSDTEIEVTVPSTIKTASRCAGTGVVSVVDQSGVTGTSATNLTVQYGHTNIVYDEEKYGANLVEDNGNGGLTFTLSTSICSSSFQDAVNAVGRALRTWRCATGVNWSLSTSTSGINAPASDGTNIITFDTGSPLGSGVLGVAHSYFSGCFSGSDLYWSVAEVDLNLRKTGVTWYYCDNPATIPGGSFDFQSVAFHELGHGHQLAHVIDATAVMHRSISAGQVKRTLNSNEQAGADYIFGLPAHPCGAGPMDPLGNPACLGLTPPGACNAAGPCTLSLPVELTDYSGQAKRDGILLEWATATERNNDFFTLERSTDALAFEPLAKIPGAGTTVQPVQYQFLDKKPLPGLNYYRLRQTDFDGGTALLGMVAVPFGNTSNDLRVHPNPVQGPNLFVELASAGLPDEPLDLILTDLLGHIIRQERASGASTSLPVADLPAGTYLLRVCPQGGGRCAGPVLVVR
ncbi:MAG: IPT/TIG domain-containing protein [Saprospiraceae bacterium]